jgi:hypothetical protein
VRRDDGTDRVRCCWRCAVLLTAWPCDCVLCSAVDADLLSFYQAREAILMRRSGMK